MAVYHYVFRYDSNELFEVTWSSPTNRKLVEDIADDLVDDYINSVEVDIEKQEVRRVIGFCDSPWESKDDITSSIKSLDSVKSCFYSGAFQGKYGPPKVVIRFEEGKYKKMEENILDYYDGLVVKKHDDGEAIVIISPLADLD